MGLPVSETSSKETCEGRDVVEVGALQLTVGGDGASPHQILHTEIFEPLVEGETGHGMLKDTLRGGIRLTTIPGPIPGAGRSPPDVGIGRGATRVTDVRRIITRDVVKVMNIAAGAGRHVLVLLVSDEGDDGIVPPDHHPLYNLPFSPRRHHSLSADPLAHRVWPWHLSQIMMPLRSSAIGVIFVPVHCIDDDSCLDGGPHSFLSFSHIIVSPLCYL